MNCIFLDHFSGLREYNSTAEYSSTGLYRGDLAVFMLPLLIVLATILGKLHTLCHEQVRSR
jgi:hypothetical protein